MSGHRGLVDHSALTLRDLIATRADSPVEVFEAHFTEIAHHGLLRRRWSGLLAGQGDGPAG